MVTADVKTKTDSFYVLRMPCGEYLRSAFENVLDDENDCPYDTTPDILCAYRMHIQSKLASMTIYRGSALNPPKYFLTQAKHYTTVEEFCKDTGASVQRVTTLTTTTTESSPVYCSYSMVTEAHITSIPLQILQSLRDRKWSEDA